MALHFPSILLPQAEAQQLANAKLAFNSNGYLIDPNLSIQKTLEDIFERPILLIQKTSMGQIIILTDPYGLVQNNPVTHRRLAILSGDVSYITSTLQLMVQFHPDVKPHIVIESYAFQCSPIEKMNIRTWIQENYKS